MTKKIIPGTDLTVQNIFCIGRNYSEHAKELNNPVPTSPVVFIKPTSSICYSGENLIIPSQSSRVDHEIEVVIVVGATGKNIPEQEVHKYISHVGVGLDFTARDLQDKAKEKGLPWSIAKGFDTFAAIGHFEKMESLATDFHIELKVNGEVRQKGHTGEMIFSLASLVAYLSGVFTLNPGDLIFTGTPAGVGPLSAGDKIEAKIQGHRSLLLGVQKA